MSIKSGFFNANLESGEYDRIYKAEDFASYFGTFISNGVFMGPDGDASVNMKVVSDPDVAMGIKVKTGNCYINGYYANVIEEEEITLDLPDGTLNRIDVIVARLSFTNRIISIEVLKGDLANSPVPKPITRNGAIYELKLAEVYIAAGSVQVVDSNITDFRPNYEVCGWVKNILKQNNGIVAEEHYEEGGEQKIRNVDFVGIKYQTTQPTAEEVQEGQLVLQYEPITSVKVKKDIKNNIIMQDK